MRLGINREEKMKNEQDRTIWIVRHGLREDSHPVEWFKPVGHMEDPDLADVGKIMAIRAAIRLSREQEPIHHLISSPFARTLRTSQYCATKLGMKIKVDYAVHEQLDPNGFTKIPPNLPSLQERLMEFPQIDMTYESVMYPSKPEPSGDPDGQIMKRCATAIQALLEKNEGNMVIVTHYAVCNVLTHFLGGAFSDRYIEMSSITKFKWNGTAWEFLMKACAEHINGLHEWAQKGKHNEYHEANPV